MFRVTMVKKSGPRSFDLVVENGEGFQFLAHYQSHANQVELGKTLRSGSYVIGDPQDTYEQLGSVVRKAVEEYRADLAVPLILEKKPVRRRA